MKPGIRHGDPCLLGLRQDLRPQSRREKRDMDMDPDAADAAAGPDVADAPAPAPTSSFERGYNFGWGKGNESSFERGYNKGLRQGNALVDCGT